MTTANLLARLRTLLDEASASFWTDAEAYQALTAGQNALSELALSVYRAKKLSLSNMDVPLSEVLNAMYAERTGTIPNGNSQAVWNSTSTGGVTSASIGSGGVDYVVGDLIYVTSAGNKDCVLRVTGLSGPGVSTFDIVYAGSGYSNASGLATTTNSVAGTGFTLTIMAVGTYGPVLELIWLKYNPAATTPLYPVRVRNVAGGSAFQQANSFLQGSGSDYFAQFKNNNTITFETASTNNSATYNAGVIAPNTDIDASHNPTLPDSSLEPIVQYAFALLLSKDQRLEESKNAFARYMTLAQPLVS